MKNKLCMCAYFSLVGDANDGKSPILSEVDSIVDSAFSKMMKSAENTVPNLVRQQSEPSQNAEVRSSRPSVNEHNLDGSNKGGRHQDLHVEEIHESADVDVSGWRKQGTRLKGDATTNDEVSLKQWREQRRRMDLREESSHKTAGTSSQGISRETVTHSHFPSRQPGADDDTSDDDRSFRGKESIQDYGSSREKVDRGVPAESEDIRNKQSDSVDADSDVNEAQHVTVQGSAGEEEHDRSQGRSEETDVQQSSTVETGETAAVAGEDEKGFVISEGPDDKEALPDDDDRKEEEQSELGESSSSARDDDDDDDEMQGTWRSAADSHEENAASDAIEHEATNTKNDQTFLGEEHHGAESPSNFINEELPHNIDDSISDTLPVKSDVLDTDDADIMLDGRSSGWIQSALDAIYSFIDAAIDMVRQTFFM